MLDSEERKVLWDHMMEADSDLTWVTGWFLDNPDSVEDISRYDIFDFICWAMFDGRNQEHLTTQELQDLESFVEDMEYRISLTLYGVVVDEDDKDVSDTPLELVEEKDKEDITEGRDRENGRHVHADDGRSTRDCDCGDFENKEKEDERTLPRQGRTSSSNLSTISRSNRTDSDQNIGFDESEYSTPKRSLRRNEIVSEDDSTLWSGSDNWSSVASSRRPRPKKCKSIPIEFRLDDQTVSSES
jgi:hypothetical protein